MTPKQYREFYIGCVKLYGVIDSDNAFDVFKHYYPEAEKKSFIKDLSTRFDKFTHTYSVWKTKKRNLYLIVDEFLDSESIDAILGLQKDKDYYIPKTYDKFLNHSSYNYWEQYNNKEVKELKKILRNNGRGNTDLCVTTIFYDFQSLSYYDGNDPLTMTLKRLLFWGFEFDFETTQKVVGIIQTLYNNTRLWVNRGYMPSELLKKHGPINLNKTELSLGPNIKEMFYNGEIDIDDYIQGVLNNDLPQSMKESLLKELIAIKREIDDSKA